MLSILQHSHSGLRYVSLILLILLIATSIQAVLKGSTFTVTTRKLSFFATLSIHIQLLIGLALYFLSPKVIFNAATMKTELLRFFTMEHPLMMLIAIALITIGGVKAKRLNSPKSHRTILIYCGIGFLVLMAGIPWPFREALSVGWF